MKNSIVKITGFFFLLLSINGCEKNIESKINHSINALNEKFPQLKTGKKRPQSQFTFEKSVRNGKYNFEILLYSQPEGYPERNQIIVIKNAKNEVYSLPLFNNKYKNYWQFPFDKPIPGVSKITATFTEQMNTAIDTLVPNNDRKKRMKQYHIINELLTSVLNCKNIQEKDSTLFFNIIRGNPDLPDEDIKTALIRIRKNYELMKKQWNPQNLGYSNSYFDERNARVYQVNFIKNKVKIRTYRIDYGMHYIDL
ncbi:hypothetical protein [Flavobacterium gelatinilyticum]|uniref:hypothetical protein n=1 Tax=Flavobacterium gelatinilyticum TaxID=3003260 RepID=UPI0024807B4B|nr:hypothetical protein [Flavobacterium gelatinilyticum]